MGQLYSRQTHTGQFKIKKRIMCDQLHAINHHTDKNERKKTKLDKINRHSVRSLKRNVIKSFFFYILEGLCTNRPFKLQWRTLIQEFKTSNIKNTKQFS